MFECKFETVNVGLIDRFADFGYSTYRLIPGLNVLVPFDRDEPSDPFLLNLFCCKDDRAMALENAGWLVRRSPRPDSIETEGYDAWENDFYSLPFAQRIRELWQKSPAQSDETYLKAIELYFLAHVGSRSSCERYRALRASFDRLKQIAGAGQKLTCLSTFARVAAEMGFRVAAFQAIVRQREILGKTRHASLDEPFLPVSSRFDHFDPGNRLDNWFLASLLEGHQTLKAYSSYYTGLPSLGDLEAIKSLGFQSPEMERRRQLVRMRYGIQLRPSSLPLLSKKTESNLNPEFWSAVD